MYIHHHLKSIPIGQHFLVPQPLNPSGLSSNTRQPAQIKIPGLRSAISRLWDFSTSDRWANADENQWPPKTTSLLVEINSQFERFSVKTIISPLTSGNKKSIISRKCHFSFCEAVKQSIKPPDQTQVASTPPLLSSHIWTASKPIYLLLLWTIFWGYEKTKEHTLQATKKCTKKETTPT